MPRSDNQSSFRTINRELQHGVRRQTHGKWREVSTIREVVDGVGIYLV